MSAKSLLNLLGGDIISKIIDAPTNLIREQMAHSNRRKDMQLEQELRQEDEKFRQEMELQSRKLNAELDAFIAEKEIERSAKIAESIANYQKTMAECSVSIGKSLGMMNVELREKATALVMEKQEQYKKLQESATEKAMSQLENIAAKFPEGSKANEMMTESVVNQLNNIVETSNRFMQTIDADFAKMMDSIGRITEKTMDNANQYISPTFAKTITRGSSDGDMKLLK